MPPPVIVEALEVGKDDKKDKDAGVAGSVMKTIGKLNVFG